jgi:2-polyprenyl-3-methyl-5-hydroxy-6-metoxy-1,4-benzoquinol methylase
VIPCDLCGAEGPAPILESVRLDGPLVRCRHCGFYYTGQRRSALTFGSAPADEVVERVREANRRLQGIELDEEHRLAELTSRSRLQLIRRFQPSGRLLEVGCARGDFLRVAREAFTVKGVEPNPELARDAMQFAPIHQGLVEDEPGSGYDVAASFHVIEHTDSPRRFFAAMASRLAAGGIAVIETPDIGSLPFRVFRGRWRQFIPEHYYFFDRTTLVKLFEEHDLTLEHVGRVGKYASLTLVANRLARYFGPFRLVERLSRSWPLANLAVELNPLDILIAVGRKK